MHKKILPRVVAFLILTAGTLLTVAPVAHAGLTAEQKCQKARYDAAAKYAQCQNSALGQLFATNDLTKLQPVLSKCRVKYADTWLKLQKKALGTGSTCDSPRFVNGPFGPVTVIDNLTGLEWRKKDDNGGIHDKDNTHSWVGAYRDFITPYHAFCSTIDCLFYNWRLPTVVELQTILSEPFPCTTSPCVTGVLGPTAEDDYWSSTILADNPTYAWTVFFGTGQVGYAPPVRVQFRPRSPGRLVIDRSILG